MYLLRCRFCGLLQSTVYKEVVGQICGKPVLVIEGEKYIVVPCDGPLDPINLNDIETYERSRIPELPGTDDKGVS